MTRANLNFTYIEKGKLKVLYHYQNGDQYPTGIRDFYNVLNLLENFTPDGFKSWLATNYKVHQQVTSTGQNFSIVTQEPTEVPATPTSQNSTTIDGFTDYSYVFNSRANIESTIQVYNWDKQIFNGTLTKFKNWIKKQ